MYWCSQYLRGFFSTPPHNKSPYCLRQKITLENHRKSGQSNLAKFFPRQPRCRGGEEGAFNISRCYDFPWAAKTEKGGGQNQGNRRSIVDAAKISQKRLFSRIMPFFGSGIRARLLFMRKLRSISSGLTRYKCIQGW